MELEDDDMVLLEDDGAHPTITAEMPGIELEDEQIGPIPAVEEMETSEVKMAAAASLNVNLALRPEPGQPQDDHDIPGVEITGVPTLVDEEEDTSEDDDVDVVDGPDELPPIINDITDDDEATVMT